MAKKPLNDEVLSEWDVVRRTAEFFDGILGNLRTFGLTASVTLIGFAFEFRVSPLFLASTLLSVALVFIDHRYQAYLGVTAKYAMRIESNYNFVSSGLTYVLTEERNKHRFSRPEDIFRMIYGLLAFAGIVGFILVMFVFKT